MSEKKCINMHKLGPFVLDNNGATRECFCCKEVFKYSNIGDDIKEAIKRQEDASLFAGAIINKKYNVNDENFIKLIGYLYDDFDYLFINNETQNKLLNNLTYYNNMLIFDKDTHKFIEDIGNYFKLCFARDKYEYKLGFDSFPKDEIERIDSLAEHIDKSFKKLNNEKKHLSK